MLLGFKKRFEPYILEGSKTHTIRRVKKNPPRTEEKNLERRLVRAIDAAIAKREARAEPVTDDGVAKDVMDSHPDLIEPLARQELVELIFWVRHTTAYAREYRKNHPEAK